jgi:hypothetical protein
MTNNIVPIICSLLLLTSSSEGRNTSVTLAHLGVDGVTVDGGPGESNKLIKTDSTGMISASLVPASTVASSPWSELVWISGTDGSDADGDGTMYAPYATLTNAFESVGTGIPNITYIMAPGTYELPPDASDSGKKQFTLFGLPGGDVRLTGTMNLAGVDDTEIRVFGVSAERINQQGAADVDIYLYSGSELDTLTTSIGVPTFDMTIYYATDVATTPSDATNVDVIPMADAPEMTYTPSDPARVTLTNDEYTVQSAFDELSSYVSLLPGANPGDIAKFDGTNLAWVAAGETNMALIGGEDPEFSVLWLGGDLSGTHTNAVLTNEVYDLYAADDLTTNTVFGGDITNKFTNTLVIALLNQPLDPVGEASNGLVYVYHHDTGFVFRAAMMVEEYDTDGNGRVDEVDAMPGLSDYYTKDEVGVIFSYKLDVIDGIASNSLGVDGIVGAWTGAFSQIRLGDYTGYFPDSTDIALEYDSGGYMTRDGFRVWDAEAFDPGDDGFWSTITTAETYAAAGEYKLFDNITAGTKLAVDLVVTNLGLSSFERYRFDVVWADDATASGDKFARIVGYAKHADGPSQLTDNPAFTCSGSAAGNPIYNGMSVDLLENGCEIVMKVSGPVASMPDLLTGAGGFTFGESFTIAGDSFTNYLSVNGVPMLTASDYDAEKVTNAVQRSGDYMYGNLQLRTNDIEQVRRLVVDEIRDNTNNSLRINISGHSAADGTLWTNWNADRLDGFELLEIMAIASNDVDTAFESIGVIITNDIYTLGSALSNDVDSLGLSISNTISSLSLALSNDVNSLGVVVSNNIENLDLADDGLTLKQGGAANAEILSVASHANMGSSYYGDHDNGGAIGTENSLSTTWSTDWAGSGGVNMAGWYGFNPEFSPEFSGATGELIYYSDLSSSWAAYKGDSIRVVVRLNIPSAEVNSSFKAYAYVDGASNQARLQAANHRPTGDVYYYAYITLHEDLDSSSRLTIQMEADDSLWPAGSAITISSINAYVATGEGYLKVRGDSRVTGDSVVDGDLSVFGTLNYGSLVYESGVYDTLYVNNLVYGADTSTVRMLGDLEYIDYAYTNDLIDADAAAFDETGGWQVGNLMAFDTYHGHYGSKLSLSTVGKVGSVSTVFDGNSISVGIGEIDPAKEYTIQYTYYILSALSPVVTATNVAITATLGDFSHYVDEFNGEGTNTFTFSGVTVPSSAPADVTLTFATTGSMAGSSGALIIDDVTLKEVTTNSPSVAISGSFSSEVVRASYAEIEDITISNETITVSAVYDIGSNLTVRGGAAAATESGAGGDLLLGGGPGGAGGPDGWVRISFGSGLDLDGKPITDVTSIGLEDIEALPRANGADGNSISITAGDGGSEASQLDGGSVIITAGGGGNYTGFPGEGGDGGDVIIQGGDYSGTQDWIEPGDIVLSAGRAFNTTANGKVIVKIDDTTIATFETNGLYVAGDVYSGDDPVIRLVDPPTSPTVPVGAANELAIDGTNAYIYSTTEGKWLQFNGTFNW